MPFIDIKIAKGHSAEIKSEMARKIADAVIELTGLTENDVWIVFQDIPDNEWFVGRASIRELDSRAS